MATVLKYTLKEITDISFSGFNYTIPDETFSMINYLCSHVGIEELKSPVFQKADTPSARAGEGSSVFGSAANGYKLNNKKKKGNKGMEVSAEEWETLRTFQATKIEAKTGIDCEIDQIRLLLNKLTDKTFLDIREKMIAKMNEICSENLSSEDKDKIASMVYDICSTNKFYSKIFADFYAELITLYTWLRPLFNEKEATILELYKNIQYVDPEVNYDGFCDMNKVNEKRKAVTTFFVNLANNGFIKASKIVETLTKLLTMVNEMVNQSDKKNEVDELTENIAILFNKEMIDAVEDDSDDPEQYQISGNSILELVSHFAKLKAKDYPSLSNKAIFKYMDLVDM